MTAKLDPTLLPAAPSVSTTATASQLQQRNWLRQLEREMLAQQQATARASVSSSTPRAQSTIRTQTDAAADNEPIAPGTARTVDQERQTVAGAAAGEGSIDRGPQTGTGAAAGKGGIAQGSKAGAGVAAGEGAIDQGRQNGARAAAASAPNLAPALGGAMPLMPQAAGESMPLSLAMISMPVVAGRADHLALSWLHSGAFGASGEASAPTEESVVTYDTDMQRQCGTGDTARAAGAPVALRHIHLYRSSDGVHAWIRDTQLTALTCAPIVHVLQQELQVTGQRLAGVTLNGKPIRDDAPGREGSGHTAEAPVVPDGIERMT